MISMLVNYLLESSLCLLLFILVYRLLISRLTHFSWIRFFLISSVVLSLVVPLIIIPIQWKSDLIPAKPVTEALLFPLNQIKEASFTIVVKNTLSIHSVPSGQRFFIYGVFILYLAGAVYKAYSLAINLRTLRAFIKKNPKVKEADFWIVAFKNDMPAFSFFNYIFINSCYKNLSPDELQIVKNHELVHVKQYHTLDILFLELVGILFWFNPLVNYLRRSLKEIHEYIVDEKIAGESQNKKTYACLLLKLASDSTPFNLTTNFADQTIKRRILMMTKPRSSSKTRHLFFILIPLTAILLFSFSCSKNSKSNPIGSTITSSTDKSPLTDLIELEKYSGVYLPSKNDFQLRPMDIVVLHHKLYRFIEQFGEPANKMIELRFISNHKFAYMDDSDRSIEFILNNKNEVKGCVLTRPDGVYGLLKENNLQVFK